MQVVFLNKTVIFVGRRLRMDSKTKLFREKSVEVIESPEALNDYLRVTSPGIWLILASVVLFLIAVCIWGVFGHIDSTMDTAVVSKDGDVDCLVPEEAISGVLKNPSVKIDDLDYELKPSTLKPEIIRETDANLAAVELKGDLKWRKRRFRSLRKKVWLRYP